MSQPEDISYSGGIDAGISGVQVAPGATALTRIPRVASDIDKNRVKVLITPLVAE